MGIHISGGILIIVSAVVCVEIGFETIELTILQSSSLSVENQVILTVSLGSPRQWVMTRRLPHGAKAAAKRSGQPLPKSETHRWTVEPGSLLLMQGKTQEDWYHEIPKQTKIKDGRIVSPSCARRHRRIDFADRNLMPLHVFSLSR